MPRASEDKNPYESHSIDGIPPCRGRHGSPRYPPSQPSTPVALHNRRNSRGRPPHTVEETGEIHPLTAEVTTVGRGRGVDIILSDPSVSQLHAEIVRRGPYVYVVDMGLSRNGTRVNGRPIAQRVLREATSSASALLGAESADCRKKTSAPRWNCAGAAPPNSPAARSTS